MTVSEKEYEHFRETMLEIRDSLDRLESKIGNVPMTVEFLRSVNRTLADVMQMYFKEIRSN